MRCARGHCLLKRIKINDYKIDFRNSQLGHCIDVALIVATAENAAEYLGVESLDTSAENRRIAGEIFHGVAGVTFALDE